MVCGGEAPADGRRWYGQFTEPCARLVAHFEVGEREGSRVHLFQASGTFIGVDTSGMRIEAPNYAFMGANLEGKSGDVFIHFVAPKSLAAGAGLTRAAVGGERKTAREMCLDDKIAGLEHHETALHAGWSALPTRSDLPIAMESINCYSDGRNWWSSGECQCKG